LLLLFVHQAKLQELSESETFFLYKIRDVSKKIAANGKRLCDVATVSILSLHFCTTVKFLFAVES